MAVTASWPLFWLQRTPVALNSRLPGAAAPREHLRNRAAQIPSAIIESALVVLFHICAEVVELADTPS